jgi:hypothetical protein
MRLTDCNWFVQSVTDYTFPDINYDLGETIGDNTGDVCKGRDNNVYGLVKINLGNPVLWYLYQTPYTLNGEFIYWIQSNTRATLCPNYSYLAWDDADCQASFLLGDTAWHDIRQVGLAERKMWRINKYRQSLGLTSCYYMQIYPYVPTGETSFCA